MRVLLYTGKGGVGKTTTAAATAAWAASRGTRTLVLSADSAHSLGDVLGERLGPSPLRVADNLDAVEVDAREEMTRHWGHIRDYLVSLFRYQGIEEVIAEELALLPGVDELATLFAVENFAQQGAYDLVIVDCAPTDAALRLATLPDVARASLRVVLRMQRAVAAIVTPLAHTVVPVPLPDSAVFADVERLLYKTLKRLRVRLTAASTSIRIVVTPEQMVIEEARRAFTEFALFDLSCDLVIMNRMLPADALDEAFFKSRGPLEAERLGEVRENFAPLPVLVAPLRQDEVCGIAALERHGEDLFSGGDPAPIHQPIAKIRFERAGDGYRVHVPLPGSPAASKLDVVKIEDELFVTVGSRRRAVKLPPRLATCSLTSARRTGEKLEVTLGSPERAGSSGRGYA